MIALNLYHKLRFGQLHARQPVIISLSKKLGRGANSVAMKLCNFASLDPALKLRGIKGLAGASLLDRHVWNDFHRNLNDAAPASEDAFRKLFDVDEDSDLEISPTHGLRIHKPALLGPTEVTVPTRVRRGQDFFREAVINNSGGCCSVTRLTIRTLLVASHILPWRSHPEYRLEVRNGLCLSRLHDAAFDCGLISFDDELRLLVSRKLRGELSQRSVAENFGSYEGVALYFPEDAVLPDTAFLSKHRATIFQRS